MSNLNIEDLPEGWTSARIDTVCDVNPRINKSEIPDDLLVSFVPMPAVGAGDGSIDVSQERPASEVKKGFTAFKQGDVLFAKITPCMENGKMAVVPKVVNDYGFGSTEFHVLRPKEEIDARYVYYFVSSQNFRGVAERYMTGAVGQKRVSTTYLKEQSIPLAPLEQQKRIVAEIEKQFSRLDEAVANLKRVKANLKRYKAAVLKAAVEGKLTEEWRKQHPDVEPADKLLERILEERRANWEGRGKYKEPVGPDTTGLPELPKGWVWTCVGQLGAVKGGKRLPAGHSYAESPTPFPYIRVTDFKDFGIRTSELLYLSEETQRKISRYTISADDIYISIAGTIGLVGQVPTQLSGANLTENAAKITDICHTNQKYLICWLSSPDGIVNIAQSTIATTQAKLALFRIEKIPTPLPSLDEQHQIVAEVERRLSILAGAEAQVEANLRRADRLRQSILKQAFSGQLVPQDPNDEPASVLLNKMMDVSEGETRPGSKTKGRRGRRSSKVKSEKSKKSLLDIIKKNPGGITPEALFAEANYSLDDIDMFYEQLALIRDLIEQEKPSGLKSYAWPESPLVILKPKGA